MGKKQRREEQVEGRREEQENRSVVVSVLVVFLLFVSLATVIPVALQGCGSTQTEQEPEKTTLELWYYWEVPVARQCMASLLREFNGAHADFEVVMKYVPEQDFKKTLALAVADGRMPDLAIVDASDMQYYYSMGALSEVSDCLDEDEYLELALANCRKDDGGYYGLPLGLNCLSFYYNTEILGKAEVSPPRTLDEFVAAARKVSSESVYGFAFPALQSEECLSCFLPILWATGGSMDKIASPESARAFGYLRKLAQDGSISVSSENMTLTDIIREFANERLAMIFAASGSEKLISEINPEIHFQVAEIPNGIPAISVLGGDVLAVTTQSHKEEAEAFLRFMAEPKQMKQYLSGVGALAPREDVLEWQVAEDVSKLKYLSYLQNARIRECSEHWPAVSLVVAQAVNQIILQEDPPDVLEQLAEKIAEIQEGDDE